MKRGLVLGLLVSVLSLSNVISGTQAPPAGPTPEALAATKIEKVKDNLYIITGSGADATAAFSGGNTAVFITDAGVVLVDTKLPGWGQIILDRVRTVTNKPVVTVINTHTHGDHTGSNAFFGTTVDSVVQENTKSNMARMDDFKGDNARFLPKRTYKDKITIGTGKDEIDLYYFGAGHTNGDSFVVFPAIRTMHVGDLFAWKALPYIDTSITAEVQWLTARRLSKRCVHHQERRHHHQWAHSRFDLERPQGIRRLQPGLRAWGQDQMKAGKTVDQAAAEYKLPARYKGYKVTVNEHFASVKTNLQTGLQRAQEVKS